MKYRKLYSCIIAVFLMMSVSVANAATFDKIVAVVNDEPITQSELDMSLMPVYEKYKAAYSGPEFSEKMGAARASMLNNLIEEKLMAQEAKHLEVAVTDSEIDSRLKDIRENFPDEIQFNKYLESQHITLKNLREKLSDQIAVKKLYSYEVRQKVSVSPRDIENYYNEHKDKFVQKEKVKARTILIKKNIDDNGVDQGLQKMNKVMAKIAAGDDFSAMAKEFSEGMNPQDGGDLGFVKKGDLIKEFDSVIFELNVGETSDVIKTDIGYHLFLVEAKQAEKVVPLSELKDKIHGIVYKEKIKDRHEEWLAGLKEDAYISIK